ncbi:hypothetical protein BJ878DRAFT_481036 [Calycina marina]|uniref:Uncharacterized protein n=1 Tax=Calycina marina TaxID=1763456 RepID=A0A9P7Z1S2_9HELO|nr:hypothetical protein BJ878DRAFT_481036 [Calycina marina]
MPNVAFDVSIVKAGLADCQNSSLAKMQLNTILILATTSAVSIFVSSQTPPTAISPTLSLSSTTALSSPNATAQIITEALIITSTTIDGNGMPHTTTLTTTGTTPHVMASATSVSSNNAGARRTAGVGVSMVVMAATMGACAFVGIL